MGWVFILYPNKTTKVQLRQKPKDSIISKMQLQNVIRRSAMTLLKINSFPWVRLETAALSLMLEKKHNFRTVIPEHMQ